MSDDLKTPYDDDPEKRKIFLQGAAAAKDNKPLTYAEVENMSVAEIMARKSEVNEVLRRGRDTATGGDGDDEATS